MKKMILILVGIIISINTLFAGSFDTFVKVREVQPEYKQVMIRTPYQECWDETVRENSNSGTTGALIGGVAGGILGHQIGKGGGKTAATVGGAILGTIVGKNLSSNSGDTYRTVRKCTTKYRTETQEKFIGYKNIAVFRGRKIVKFSRNRLDSIRLTVSW